MKEKTDFQIIQMFKNKKYLAISFLLLLLILILYPLFQISPLIFQNPSNFLFSLQTWFSLMSPLKWFLYLLYGILFTTTISFFIWQRKRKICPQPKMVKSGFLGGLGAASGSFLPLCPACFSLAGFLLSLNALLFLIKYSVFIMAGSTILLFCSLWFLGAFQRR